MVYKVKGFGIVKKAEVDVFLELSCFFDDPVDIGNLISGSSAFSKSSLNIWKFTVDVLLKPGLENFEHYFASVWDECTCAVVWTFLVLPFIGIGMKTDLVWSCGHCWVFQICWHIECSTFTTSFFRIWNSSIRIPSPPLALFVVMLPKAHLTSHSRMSVSRWVIHTIMIILVDPWLNVPTNDCSLIIAHLGAGPTAVLTNGWVGPPRVTLTTRH